MIMFALKNIPIHNSNISATIQTAQNFAKLVSSPIKVIILN